MLEGKKDVKLVTPIVGKDRHVNVQSFQPLFFSRICAYNYYENEANNDWVGSPKTQSS